jgi:ribulose-5-phosphate 4-epimerase/fuculose-1-phosphate aldolase
VSKLDDLLDDLVAANHVLYNEHVVDGLGHISVRDPENPARFYLSRAVAPGQVRRKDLIHYELDGTALDAEGRSSYLERFIHGEVYRVRPEINSVMHSHSEEPIVFGVTGATLRGLTHMHHFLKDVPIFEIRDSPSNTPGNLLVDTIQLGKDLANVIGSGPVALMRGHGMVTVGTSIPEAVYRGIYTVQNARLQSEAMRFNKPITFLNDEELAYHFKGFTSGDYSRPWNLWKEEARRARS